MTCRSLVLIPNEVFGQWIEAPATGAPVLPTNWNGLQWGPGNAPGTTSIGTLALTVTPATQSGSAWTVAVAGLPGGATVTLTYDDPGPNRRVSLLASIFGGGSFLVVRWVGAATGATGSITDPWLFDVVDLRSPAPTASPPPPSTVRIGPFDVQRGTDLRCCPNGSGQLVLLWGTAWGDMNGVVADRQRVVRTELSETLWDHVGWGSPSSTYRDCRTAPAAGGSFELQLFPSGTGGSLQPSNAAMEAATPAPVPGRLALSPQSATLSATSPSQTFSISNTGADYLEVTSITASTGAPLTLTVSAPFALPLCLAPGAAISFVAMLTMSPLTPATATVTVATVPAASAAVSTVTLRLDATLAALPTVTASPSPLKVPAAGGTARLNIVNAGPGSASVSVSAMTVGPVTWPSLPTQTLMKGAVAHLDVTLAPGGSVPAGTAVVVTATLPAAGTAVPVTPPSVPVVQGSPPFPPGLKILGIDFNPIGPDLELESITIGNLSSALIALDGCQLFDLVFSNPSAPSERRVFVFPAGTALPPLAGGAPVLKVMTRGRRGGDAQDPLVLYMGLNGPIWNNTGDTATLKDPGGTQVLDRYAYTTKLPGSSGGGGTVYVQPPARHRILVRVFDVPGNRDWTGNGIFVEDDDVLNIDASGEIWSGVWFQSNTAPDGRPGDLAADPSNFPLPGQQKYGLIGRIGGGDPFVVGSMLSLTVRLSAAAQSSGVPQELEFGINDDQVGDNSGKFVVRVVQYRA